LSQTALRQGQELLVEIEVDYPTPEEVGLRGGLTIEKLELREGPTMRTVRNIRSPEQLRTLVRLVYRAADTGRTIIPAYRVVVAGQEFITERRLIQIRDPQVESDMVPPDLRWRTASSRVYEGESVGVLLELRNLTEFTFPDSLIVRSPDAGLFQEVQGIGAVSRMMVDDVELLSIPIATFLLTPSQSGEVTIPPAEIVIGPYTRQSRPVSVQVEELPDAVTTTGAIGRFEYHARLSDTETRVGQSIELVRRVEGEGNLDFFRFPQVELVGAIVVGSREESQLEPSERGYRGYRQHVTELSPQTAGTAVVEVPAFAWVNPVSRVVRTVGGRELRFRVEPSGAQPATDREAPALSPLSAEEVLSLERVRFYDQWVSYLLLLPGPILFVLIVAWRRRRRLLPTVFAAVFAVVAVYAYAAEVTERESLIQSGVAALENGRYLEAIDRFETARLKRPESAGLFYNLGIAYHRLDDSARAVYNLRRAVEARPFEPRFRRALQALEESIGLVEQLEPAGTLHPDAYFLIGVILLNGAFLVLALRAIPGGGRIIVATVLFLLSAGAFATLGYNVTLGDRAIAVVGPDSGELRRIPDTQAAPWMTLPVATSVEVVKRIPPLILVRTAYGVEGWISEDNILDGNRD
jgi:hypothetical protein